MSDAHGVRSFPCHRCKRKEQCDTPRKLCTECRAKAFIPKDGFSPYAIAFREVAEQHGESRAIEADRLHWESSRAFADLDLLNISRRMYSRMALLANVETQSERTERTIAWQRAAQERKKERRRTKELAA